MRKTVSALALAAFVLPMAAQAADSRPGAVSYAAPATLGSGMRAGARTGAQSKDDGLGSIALLALGVGGGIALDALVLHLNKDSFNSSPN